MSLDKDIFINYMFPISSFYISLQKIDLFFSRNLGIIFLTAYIFN